MNIVKGSPALFAIFAVAMSLAFATLARAQDAVNPADTQATRSVIEDQLEAFKAHDDLRAYSHAAPGIKRMFPSVERFMSMVKGGYAAIYSNDGYSFGRNTSLSGEVYQEVIITDQAGKQWQAVYTLKQQPDGSWKITGVKMNPYKALSA